MVEILKSRKEFILRRTATSGSVGFVPTMGNLHEGHLSLLSEALHHHDVVFFSIFVNPKQFGPNEDFGKYPRSLEADIEKLDFIANKFSDKKVILFAPTTDLEIFPAEETQMVSVYELSTELEGKLRPGHFDGVATVVYRLFELVKPHAAYFGLKDYQQFMVINQMVEDLNLPIKIHGMPIVREPSGLALSSRNQYLSIEQKEAALLIFKTLNELKNIFNNNRSRLALVQDKISSFLEDSNWDYLELRDSKSFSNDLSQAENITILAVYRMGKTRLLDNMQVEVQ